MVVFTEFIPVKTPKKLGCFSLCSFCPARLILPWVEKKAACLLISRIQFSLGVTTVKGGTRPPFTFLSVDALVRHQACVMLRAARS
jgi:hypothetical protein